jgi:hypothetical protein
MPWLSDLAPRCYRCHRERGEHERFSRRGFCSDCGDGEMQRNVAELRAHRGPRFLRWRRGVAAGVGAVLLDDLAAEDEASAA